MIKEQLTDAEKAKFDETVGLVEASIGRMVPVQTEEMKDGEPLRVCVESYGFLPVDGAAFKGEIPQIEGMVPFEPFDFFIKRKLFIHNMGHATTAYLGGLLGDEFVWQSIGNPAIRLIAQNAMTESAMALSRHYNVPLEGILLHITDLLGRFANVALGDTCARVGGDPARKLSPADRMIGSSLLALQEGITPAYIAVGAAAGIKRYLDEAGEAQSLAAAEKVLSEVSQLSADAPLAKLILPYYKMIIEGCTVEDLLKAADAAKKASMDKVI